MSYDLSTQAASLEDAISSLKSALEMLEGCECDEEMDIVSEAVDGLTEKYEEVLTRISDEAKSTVEELTRLYYRER